MRISHVIRGDEWLTSTPKHVLLYRAFGWSVPSFAHLPLLLKPDGTKLSKRHADSSLEYYIQRGYLPEAVLNFVALLGWNPGTTREVFASREELVQAFSLERIQKAGAVVNLDKLNWFNQQHIVLLAQSDMNRLMDLVRPQLLQAHRASLPASASESSRAALEADLSDEPFLRRVVSSLAAHVTHVSDFAAQSRFYFHAPDYAAEDARQLREKVWPDKAAWELNSQWKFETHTRWKQSATHAPVCSRLCMTVVFLFCAERLIDGTLEMLQSLPDASFDVPPPPPTSSVAQAGSTAVSASIPPAAAAAAAATPSSPSAAPSIQESLKRVLKQHGAGAKQKTYFLLLRFVLTGSESGPAISVMLATLGRQRALQRLRQADAYTPPIPVPSS
jgi:glutamyl/glutaminyl-tRNA synthetase